MRNCRVRNDQTTGRKWRTNALIIDTLEVVSCGFGEAGGGNTRSCQKKSRPRTQQRTKAAIFLSLEKGVMEELMVLTLRKKAIYSDGEARRSNRSRKEPRGSRKTSGRLLKSEERPQAMVACRTKQKCRSLSKQARRRKSVPASELWIKSGRAECRRKGRLALSFEK